MTLTEAGPSGTGGHTDPPERRPTVLPYLVGALAVVLLALPVLASATGVRDGFQVNGDEAVAALLPVEFGGGNPVVLFPGNSYQGVLETPVYAVLWWLAGPHETAMRVFHQLVWLAALATWAWAALEVVGRRRPLPPSARWWAALAVLGLVGTTSVAGWPVWYRLYPGYQLGAALGGAAVVVAVRSRSLRSWFAAGVLAGLAVYAQPMHVVAGVAVAVAALWPADPAPSRGRRVAAVAGGGLLGALPLLVWNLRNSFATLSGDAQPVTHPEWGYPQRLANVVRITGRVLWGDGSPDLPLWASVLRVGVAVAVLVAAGAGVVALVRAGRAGWPLLTAIVVALLGLPVLPALSLDVEYRYAVGWWPALVVAVAAGAAALAGSDDRAWRRWSRVALGTAVAVHLVVVAVEARAAIDERTRFDDAGTNTRDLAADLERCGVDVVAGDYWAVYPAAWGSEADLDGVVVFGPQRLDSVVPEDWAEVERVAALPPPPGPDPEDAVNLIASRTGRGRDGWIPAVHGPTGTVVFLERTDADLPAGCLGGEGLSRAG